MSEGLGEVLERFLTMPFPGVRQSAAPALIGSLARLAVTDGRIERPKPDELIVICRRIDAALAAGEALSRRDLKRAPWCLWAPDMPLAEVPGRLDRLTARIEAADRAKLFKTLALAWGQAFAPGRVGIDRVGRFLAERAERIGAGWAEAHRRWSLFDPALGPTALAEAAIAARRAPEDLLADVGLRDFAGCVGYCGRVHGEGYARMEGGAMPDGEARLETVRAWILDAGGAIRFQALAGAAVRAVLDPFGDAMPEREIRDRFTGFALTLLGDPRSQAHRWTDCPKSREIMRRWLTEQTLRQFLDVVDRVAPAAQWQYRRAFWYALHEKDVIDDAWVVFDGEGEREARRMFGEDIEFGRFDGPVQSGHAALLLKIGTLVAAEWSHASPCSFWDASRDEVGPPLGRSSYAADALKKRHRHPIGDDDLARQGIFYHRGSDAYVWQGRIADYLRERRRINLTTRIYTVR